MYGPDQANSTSEELIVRYTVGRRTIWQWYWRKWRTNLWKIHLRLFILLALVALPFSFLGEELWKRLCTAVLVALCCVALFPLVPMILYRSHERRLTISSRGVEVIRGKKNGMRTWSEISAISEEGDHIILETKKMNSFIIPNAAFKCALDRDEFLNMAKRFWNLQKAPPQI